MIKRPLFLLPLLLLLAGLVSLPATAVELVVKATPDGGLQPRLLNDPQGNIHLLYFKKRLDRPQAREGNLYYREYNAQANDWGLPVRVSSTAFNLQTVSISRAAMAVDGSGRIHVVWYLPREAQYLYTRSDPSRTVFAPQQSMVTEYVVGLDAGADVAAAGNQVAIVWGAGDLSREYERTVFARLSDDNGASFGPELMLGNPDLGACACCSLATDFAGADTLAVAYRSAINGIGRHMQMLQVAVEGTAVADALYGPVHELQQWELSACPLSTNDLTHDAEGALWSVFETQARIVQARWDHTVPPSLVGAPATETRQKNPAMAITRAGERLVVWGEGISHSRGGRLNLRLFDADGLPLASTIESIETIEIPEFSFPAAAVLPNGAFLVLY